MADALLSPAVGGGMYAASAALVAYAVTKFKKDDPGESKIPLMAVSGAMVFAAQMINFTIPGTGSSGHIGGGVLLAALLGPFAALLALAAVLIIQCLFFADGGLLALGCNIFNIAVIPCLFIYPLVFRRLLSPSPTAKRIWVASVVSVVVALQLGAFCVVIQTTASGIALLPFSAFALLMQPIHLAIGVVEGLVTAAILNYVYAARPQILTTSAFGHASPLGETAATERRASSSETTAVNTIVPAAATTQSALGETAATGDTALLGSQKAINLTPAENTAEADSKLSPVDKTALINDTAASSATPTSGFKTSNGRSAKPMKAIIITFACITVALAVGLSLFASSNPDGLEWSILNMTGSTELEAGGGIFNAFASIQDRLSFMPGYDFASGTGSGAPLAGIVGAVLVFAAALIAGFFIRAANRKRRQP